MLKKIVLLVAVISGASSVSFGAAAKSFSQKIADLQGLKNNVANAKADALDILGKANLDQNIIDAKATLAGADTDDSNREARTADVTAAVNALATATTSAQQSHDADVAAAEKNLKDSEYNTFAVRSALAGKNAGEAGFVSRDASNVILKGRSAVKSVATLSALVATAEAGRKIKAALGSKEFKDAKGAKAKALAFGKALNLSPRQSKVLYGALFVAATGTAVNKFVPATKYF